MTHETTLDPEDWGELRAIGHRMLDDMFDYVVGVRDRPVWQKMPGTLREELRAPLPDGPAPIGDVYADFRRLVEPYATGTCIRASWGGCMAAAIPPPCWERFWRPG